MNKKSFLLPFATVLAALSPSSNATAVKSVTPVVPELNAISTGQALSSIPGSSIDRIVQSNGDLFKFVISRTAQGSVVAEHHSHSSHRSHSSHYSSR